MGDLATQIEAINAELIDFRRVLHAHPELAYHESGTAARIVKHLNALPGMRVTSGIGGTGVVGLLGADRPGPCLALRADMDALPIQETTGLSYASKAAGVMHACGHDGHMACLLGAAMILSSCEHALPGPVKFIFQPAEEGGAGALKMREAGVLDDPPVRAVFALHNAPLLPLGSVGFCPGVAFASTDSIDIRLTGAGCHAALPHQGVDPILAGAHVITALQSITSRETASTEALVVTIGRFQGGTVRNVIPDTVEMQGTMRALNEEVRCHARECVRRVVAGTAATFGAEVETVLEPGYPCLRNDAGLADGFTQVASEWLGDNAVVTDMAPSLVGEDFAYFSEQVPGLMWWLGTRDPAADSNPGLHHPDFDFEDRALALGVALHCRLVLQFNPNRFRINNHHG